MCVFIEIELSLKRKMCCCGLHQMSSRPGAHREVLLEGEESWLTADCSQETRGAAGRGGTCEEAGPDGKRWFLGCGLMGGGGPWWEEVVLGLLSGRAHLPPSSSLLFLYLFTTQ